MRKVMKIDEEAIKQFKELYLQEYGIELTDQEVIELGIRLIMFVKAVYGKNIPKPRIDKVKQK